MTTTVLIFSVIGLVIALVTMATKKPKPVKFTLAIVEKTINDAKETERNPEEGAWWMNRTASALGAENTAMEELTECVSAKNQEADGAHKDAEYVLITAQEKADDLRERASICENAGKQQFESYKDMARSAENRVKELEKIKEYIS